MFSGALEAQRIEMFMSPGLLPLARSDVTSIPYSPTCLSCFWCYTRDTFLGKLATLQGLYLTQQHVPNIYKRKIVQLHLG